MLADVVTLEAVGIEMESSHRHNNIFLFPHVFRLLDPLDDVLNFRVAIVTLNLVIRDVHLMDFFRLKAPGQDLGIPVTLDTGIILDMSITLDDTQMARFTGHAPFDVLVVFIRHIVIGIDENRLPVLEMAELAVSHLGVVPRLVEMALEARAVRNRHMFPLNDLGMAGHATELFATAEFRHVLAVIEVNPFVDDVVPIDLLLGMAPFPHTARVIDLRVIARRNLPRNHQNDMGLGLPFTPKLILKSRLEMALDAVDILVARMLPGFDIGIHVVTQTAELGRFRRLKQCQHPKNDDNEKDDIENNDSLPMLFGATNRFPEKVSQEIDDQCPHTFNH